MEELKRYGREGWLGEGRISESSWAEVVKCLCEGEGHSEYEGEPGKDGGYMQCDLGHFIHKNVHVCACVCVYVSVRVRVHAHQHDVLGQ